MGIVLIIFGILGIAGGVFGKEFHAADVIALGEFNRKVPKWLGRLVFFLAGAGLIGIGIKMLLGSE